MASSEYDLARIGAIKAYADLEHRLAYLLGKLMATDEDITWTIFFRISAARARYAIIGDLSKFRFEGAYAKAWETVELWLRPLDTARNHIVHWSEAETSVIYPEGHEPRVSTHQLLKSPAKFFRVETGGPVYSLTELGSYRERFSDMAEVVNFMALAMGGGSALHGIFQQPITHQTPTDLLRQILKTILPDPPESSQA